jgi:hypothetical protein
MARMWSEDPLPEFGPEAKCRGCERGLWRRGEGWADADGIEVCVKAPLEAIAGLHRPDYVRHAPMPPGLRGAPAV